MKDNRMLPLVSICCVTYNHEKFLSEALDSFLMQQVKFPFEIIVHDDASTDRTQEIIRAYAGKYPQVVIPVLQPENLMSKGINPTIDHCLLKARGTYIALCEGDDYWTDASKLQQQIDFLEAQPAYAGCFHETQQILADGSKSKVYGLESPLTLTAEETLAKGAPFHTSSFVFRNVLRHYPEWFHHIVSGDMALFSMVASYGLLGKIPQTMSVYRKHENGLTNTAEVINNYHQKRIELMRYLNDYHQYRFDRKAKEIIAYHERELVKAQNAQQTIDSKFLNPQFSMDNMDLYLIRKSILNALTEQLPAFTGVLLDLGCGQMPYRQYILSNSAVKKYIGLDIENPNYQQVTKPDLFWDGKKIPLEDHSVDTVIATELFEHLPDIQSVLSEAERVLKPGGIIFFTVPYLWPLHDLPHDEYRYTPFALERHLSTAKFSDISLKPTGGWDASLAQMIGLWTRRRPMSDEERRKYSELYFPVFQSLVDSERTPERFTEGLMITGITGTARKVRVNVAAPDARAVTTPHDPSDISLAIFTPNLGTLSETFIKKQIDFLAPGKTAVVYGNMLNPQWICAPTLQIPYTEGPAVYAPEVEAKVVTFLAEHKVTHLLVEYGCWGTEIIELNRRRLHLPIWVHFHGADASQMVRMPKMVEYYQWMGQQVTGIITVAKPMTDRLIHLGIPQSKITINHYGIDIPPHLSAEPDKEPCRFIFVGRLVAKKAPNLLLKAFSIAHAQYPAMHLDVVGGDFREGVVTPAEQELKRFVDAHGLADAVTFHGSVRNEKVKNLLNRSSVYVQHSVTVPENGDAEGLPNTILEACAHGLPVISTIHEGIPEEIDHGTTGLLGEEFDCEQMAEFMVMLAKNPALRKEMGMAGRKKIENEFSVERSIRNLRSILFAGHEGAY
jgi:glycosyltransferase involved in cell wall biosynthesis